jgi:hypothetical protein
MTRDKVRREIERQAARHIWNMRDKPTPSGNFDSWASWFEAEFGRTLQAAAEDFINERAAQSKAGGVKW